VHTGPGGGSDLLARAAVLMIEKEKLLPVRNAGREQDWRRFHVAAAYLFEKKGDPHTIGFSPASGRRSPIARRRGQGTMKP